MEMGHLDPSLLTPGGGISGLLRPNTPSPRSTGVTTEQVMKKLMWMKLI